MTPEERKRLRELCDKATPGPWEPCGCRFSIVTAQITPQETMDICDTKINDAISCEQAEANNCFIAAARSAVPELLDEVERLRLNNAAQECLLAEAVTGAQETEEEMERLRARVEKLEKVREAAMAWLSSFDTQIPENADSDYVDKLSAEYTDTANALRAALDRAGEP